MVGNENVEEFNPPFEEVTREEETLKTPDNSQTGIDSSLEALVDEEQTLAQKQLQDELGREPTQEETDEWLSAHTESY